MTEEHFNGKISVEVITRSGKEKTIIITHQSHIDKIKEADKLLSEMKDFKKNVLQIRELA